LIQNLEPEIIELVEVADILKPLQTLILLVRPAGCQVDKIAADLGPAKGQENRGRFGYGLISTIAVCDHDARGNGDSQDSFGNELGRNWGGHGGRQGVTAAGSAIARAYPMLTIVLFQCRRRSAISNQLSAKTMG